MDDIDGIIDEESTLFVCPECDETSEKPCAAHFEGWCAICGDLIKKGAPHERDPEFGDVFCSDPACRDIADQPTVADAAARLGNGGAS